MNKRVVEFKIKADMNNELYKGVMYIGGAEDCVAYIPQGADYPEFLYTYEVKIVNYLN